MNCPHGGSARTRERAERTDLGDRRFRCQTCRRQFKERTAPLFTRLQYPNDIVCLVVLWRLRDKLSLRVPAEMFLEPGFVFPPETVRQWEATFAPLLAERLRKPRYAVCAAGGGTRTGGDHLGQHD